MRTESRLSSKLGFTPLKFLESWRVIVLHQKRQHCFVILIWISNTTVVVQYCRRGLKYLANLSLNHHKPGTFRAVRRDGGPWIWDEVVKLFADFAKLCCQTSAAARILFSACWKSNFGVFFPATAGYICSLKLYPVAERTLICVGSSVSAIKLHVSEKEASDWALENTVDLFNEPMINGHSMRVKALLWSPEWSSEAYRAVMVRLVCLLRVGKPL